MEKNKNGYSPPNTHTLTINPIGSQVFTESIGFLSLPGLGSGLYRVFLFISESGICGRGLEQGCGMVYKVLRWLRQGALQDTMKSAQCKQTTWGQSMQHTTHGVNMCKAKTYKHFLMHSCGSSSPHGNRWNTAYQFHTQKPGSSEASSSTLTFKRYCFCDYSLYK